MSFWFQIRVTRSSNLLKLDCEMEEDRLREVVLFALYSNKGALLHKSQTSMQLMSWRQDMNYQGSTCICRVPKAQVRSGTVVECVHCGMVFRPEYCLFFWSNRCPQDAAGAVQIRDRLNHFEAMTANSKTVLETRNMKGIWSNFQAKPGSA